MNQSLLLAVLATCAVGYGIFLAWYGGRARPMDSLEAESLLDRIQKNTAAAGAPAMPDLLESLRAISREDDGREFIMVNLIKFRRKAAYPPGYVYGDDPHAADARYNRAIVPLLLKRAGLPIFLGRVAGRFLAPDGADDWESVVLVRYRSRRDLLRMCIDLAQTRADIHKWASIEKTHVFPVRMQFSLVLVRLFVAGLFALLYAITVVLSYLAR